MTHHFDFPRQSESPPTEESLVRPNGAKRGCGLLTAIIVSWLLVAAVAWAAKWLVEVTL